MDGDVKLKWGGGTEAHPCFPQKFCSIPSFALPSLLPRLATDSRDGQHSSPPFNVVPKPDDSSDPGSATRDPAHLPWHLILETGTKHAAMTDARRARLASTTVYFPPTDRSDPQALPYVDNTGFELVLCPPSSGKTRVSARVSLSCQVDGLSPDRFIRNVAASKEPNP
ncbi:unnamed protein product [Taenia asiatica]|uniref:Uncharacterized protein n=1 Tax=Taenia asiatica TaxID=60517 RepID=A0A0R3VSV8_TAEAS|nr:unnamed protein product [Taenia asiatica]